MTLKTYPLLMDDTIEDVCPVLREIIRNREYDVDYLNTMITSLLPIRCDGEMYGFHIYTTVTIPLIDVVYEVTTGFAAGVLDNATFDGSHSVIAGKSGRFLVSYNMSVKTSNPNDSIAGGVLLDGAIMYKGSGHCSTSGAGGANTIAGSLFLDATLGQRFSLGVANHTAARNIVVDSASLLIHRIP